MRIKRLSKILIIFLTLLILSSVIVHASDYGDINQFEPYTNTSGTGWHVVDNTINKTLGVVLSILRTVSLCIAILILIIIGIKYIISTPEMRAELKKQVPTYITGAVILFAASGILQLITYFVGDALP